MYAQLPKTSQHLRRAAYLPGLCVLFLLYFSQQPSEGGRQYPHPHFMDEITEARQSTLSRVVTSLTAELFQANSLQFRSCVWLGHRSDLARPLPASVSHLGEGAAPLEAPCHSRTDCCCLRPVCLHAQLLRLASWALPCCAFCCWTHYRSSPGSAARAQPRLPLSLSSWPRE